MDQQFVYRTLTTADMDEAKKFVYENYSKELPLGKIFRVKEEDIGRRNLEQTERMIKSGTSFGCFLKATGELVAITQCCVLTKGEPAAKLKCEGSYTPELAAMVRFCDWIMDDLFTELKADRLFLHSCGAVAKGYKRHKLLDGMAPLTYDTASRHGCGYEISLSGNAYSIKSVRDKTKHVLFTRQIAYADYVDPKTGKKPDLELNPVHTHAIIAYRSVANGQWLSSKL